MAEIEIHTESVEEALDKRVRGSPSKQRMRTCLNQLGWLRLR